MPVLSLPSLDLYHELHGPPDAPPLVLLHGATETFRVSWKRLIAPLSARYRVIGVDLRDTGSRRTRPARWICARWRTTWRTDSTRSVCRTAHICGFSGGASTTLFFGLRHPHRARSLVLISNNFARDEARLKGDFWSPDAIRQRDALWLKGMAAWHAVPAETLLGWWEAEDQLRPDFTPAELAALQMPVLVVGGDRDPVVPLDQTIRLFQALPNGQLAILPGVGHGAPHRAADWLDALLGNFIDGVEAKRTPRGNRSDESDHGDPSDGRYIHRPVVRGAPRTDPAPERRRQGGRADGLGPRREHAGRGIR
ncbi:MAG: alpha/beta hydrolase [Ardenticatenales bacterium]|nr:alpha/beta hydrolase [Ardenticatenales bacterium]